MVNGECVARHAGDQDQSQHWSAYGVSHHSLRWGLLCRPARPSVAGRDTASIHQLVSGINESGISWLVEVFTRAGAEAPALADPGQAGGLVSKLGDLHSVWLLLKHVMEHVKPTRFPALLQARVPICVGDLNISLRVLVLSFLGLV